MKSDFKYLQANQVSCTGMSQCNGIYKVSGGGCTWNQKFKVSCTLEGEDVYVRVQTNSLPDHCYMETTGLSILENQVDFKVKFDTDPTLLTKKSISSSTDANKLLCSNSWSTVEDMEVTNPNFDILDLQEFSGINKEVVGVLANGVPIFSGLSSQVQQDALIASSQSITGAAKLDSCLGSLTSIGLYKYHSFSPCVWSSAFKTSLTTPTLCNSDASCLSSSQTYARSKVTDLTKQTLQVIGIAKDGHQVVGPFKADGSIW